MIKPTVLDPNVSRIAPSKLRQLSSQIAPQVRTMATLNTKLPLNTSADIPAVGFGTLQDKDAQEDVVTEALKAGYRHIDTARIYGTKPTVGNTIKKSGIPRSEIFITTKLWSACSPFSISFSVSNQPC